MIEIVGVRKRFVAHEGEPPVEALGGLDLAIADNEFLTILGPSGCGKTTLLRAIAGLVPVDAGSITINGQLVRGPGHERAMVFQDFALLPWRTVLENVAFGLQVRRMPKSEREERAATALRLVGLAGFERRLPRELSGGMQQRVGLARALVVQPSVLLMDEPFGALDEQTRRVLQEELLVIWETSPITVIFITHNMQEAVLLGDRVAVMTHRPGRIADVVSVPLDRPRSTRLDDVERSDALAALTTDLWARMRRQQATIGSSHVATAD